MKRDMDVIVKLCQELEEMEAGTFSWHPSMDGLPDIVIKEHLRLAEEAGLMSFHLQQSLGGAWTTTSPRLTNLGYDFLEAMRTPERRARVTDWAKRLGRAVTIDLVVAYIRTVLTD